MSSKTWIIFATIVIIGLGGLIYLSRGDAIDVSSVDNAKPILTEEQIESVNSGLKDHIFGNPKAKSTIIVYADYSCGGCASFNERLKDVVSEKEYKDNVRIVHRHFPIKTIHPNSFSAAAYAEAIALQDEDAFWEFSERLYKNQRDWVSAPVKDRDDLILSLTSGLDIELNQVREEAKKSEVIRKINFDGALGRANGVQATPTIFIDGKTADTNEISDAPALRKALDASIKKSGVAEKSEQKNEVKKSDTDKSKDKTKSENKE